MRHGRGQRARDGSGSVEDLLSREAEEHDRRYADSGPFGLQTLNFTPHDVWRTNDHSFKKGTYLRGYRRWRLFELMELDRISGQKVLDVGCGNGQHTVLHALYGADAYGIDISRVGVAKGAEIAQANSVADLCHFAVASVSELPYPDDYFDIVVLNAVLHHIIKYPNVESDIWRVLAPGGKLMVADGLRENPLYLALRWCYRTTRRRHSDAGDVDLSMADLLRFSKDYDNVLIERFGLFEGLGEGFARFYNNPLPIRLILYLLFATDRALFRLLPLTRNYATEFVMVMNKPPRSRAMV